MWYCESTSLSLWINLSEDGLEFNYNVSICIDNRVFDFWKEANDDWNSSNSVNGYVKWTEKKQGKLNIQKLITFFNVNVILISNVFVLFKNCE